MKKLLLIAVIMIASAATSHVAHADSAYATMADCTAACPSNQTCTKDSSGGWNFTTPYICQARTCNNGGITCPTDFECKDIAPLLAPADYQCEPTAQAAQQVQQAMQAAQQSAQTQQYNGAGSLSYTPLEPLPDGGNGGQPNYGDIGSYLNYLFPILITIGALIAVTTFTISGVLYMTSSIVDKKKAAKTRMQHSLLGLLLLLSSWLILTTINPNLTNISLGNIGAQATGQSTP